MSECVEILRSIAQFWALSITDQVNYTGILPPDWGTGEFSDKFSRSPLKELAANIEEYIPWLEEYLDGGNEDAVALARELAEILGLLIAVGDRIDLWSSEALGERRIWNVVRRTAGLLIDSMHWQRVTPTMSFYSLVEQVLD